MCKSQQRQKDGNNGNPVHIVNVGTKNIRDGTKNWSLSQRWKGTRANLYNGQSSIITIERAWIFDESVWKSSNGGEETQGAEKYKQNRAKVEKLTWKNTKTNVGTKIQWKQKF